MKIKAQLQAEIVAQLDTPHVVEWLDEQRKVNSRWFQEHKEALESGTLTAPVRPQRIKSPAPDVVARMDPELAEKIRSVYSIAYPDAFAEPPRPPAGRRVPSEVPPRTLPPLAKDIVADVLPQDTAANDDKSGKDKSSGGFLKLFT